MKKQTNTQTQITAIDLHAGTVKTVAKLDPPGLVTDADPAGCVTLEEQWYVHRRHPGLVVRDIQFTNTLHQPVTISMSMRQLPSTFEQPENVSFDPRKLNVLAKLTPQRAAAQGAESDTVASIAFVFTKTKSNFTLQPRMSTRRLLLLQVVLPDKTKAGGGGGGGGVTDAGGVASLNGGGGVTLTDIDNAVDLLESASSPAALLKSHELAWAELWPLQLKATGIGSNRPWSGQLAATLASFYYLLSALELGLHGGDEHPSDGGCYVGTALRLSTEMPHHPKTLQGLSG